MKSRVISGLAERAHPKLVAHEEGHREIGEYYYANAEQAAREAVAADP